MLVLVFLLLVLMIGLPTAWLVSEFRGNRPTRIALGLLALIVTTFCLSSINKEMTTFEYNANYGTATKDLITSSLKEIEDGNLQHVLQVWRSLNSQYEPSYDRANFQTLASDAASRIRGDTPIAPGSVWDAPVFSKKTWVGHWENDTGYWIVINDIGDPLDIWRSGDPATRVGSVSLSPDFRVLKFVDENNMLLTLALRNKFEASEEWFDLTKHAVWSTDTLHKLVRATPSQKAITQHAQSATEKRQPE